MHLLLWADDSEAELRSELAEAFREGQLSQRPISASPPERGHSCPQQAPKAHAARPSPKPFDTSDIAADRNVRAPSALLQPAFVTTDFSVPIGQRLPHFAFARQWLPNVRPLRAESIQTWAAELFEAVAGTLTDEQPWSLHIEPCYGGRVSHRLGARAWHTATRGGSAIPARLGSEKNGSHPEAGRHRCQLVRETMIELLRKKRRQLLRQLRNAPAAFSANDSLIQLLLTAPDTGFISVATAPLPFEQRHLLSPFPKGEVPVTWDKAAPSRASSKLLEAELRLGRAIRTGETCVDLGASPGSWTYLAVGRGAQVFAVDRSPLRTDLMLNRQVQFQVGDAFHFKPPRSVDWLLCDVLAAPERTAELLLEWLRRGWCRHFVVTLKLKDTAGADVVAWLKRDLPPLTSEFFLTRLCANKKELCAFGSSSSSPS
jgi:23S rRNA (cytidine2498-2'-O)-methyltransferase